MCNKQKYSNVKTHIFIVEEFWQFVLAVLFLRFQSPSWSFSMVFIVQCNIYYDVVRQPQTKSNKNRLVDTWCICKFINPGPNIFFWNLVYKVY